MTHPAARGSHFRRIEKLAERTAEVAPEGPPDPLQSLELIGRKRQAHPAPEHRPQLWLGREGHAVIHPEDVTVRHRHQVAALAIGVVGDGIEDGHPAQSRVVADDHRDEVDIAIRVDPLLDHPLAEGAVAQHGRRHETPAGRLGDEERGDLALRERPLGEVEERALGDRGLVDRVERLAQRGVMDQDDQGLVRGSGQAPDDLQGAVAQRLERGCGGGATVS